MNIFKLSKHLFNLFHCCYSFCVCKQKIASVTVYYRYLCFNVLKSNETAFTCLQENSLVPNNTKCNICDEIMKTRIKGYKYKSKKIIGHKSINSVYTKLCKFFSRA